MSTNLERTVEALKVGARVAGDGMEWAGAVEKLTPLRCPSAWGTEGWDLGRWPLVVVALGEVDGVWLVAQRVEGDLYVDRYSTEEEAVAAVDNIAVSWWLSEGNGPPVEEIGTDPDAVPARFRGRYPGWGGG